MKTESLVVDKNGFIDYLELFGSPADSVVGSFDKCLSWITKDNLTPSTDF